MPKFDIPSEDNDSVDSSLLSLSSNENGAASNRSLASSVSLGLNNNHSSSPLIAERTTTTAATSIFHSLADLRSVCREPTLDAVLRKACNGSNLDTLTHIEMRVTPNVFGLHQMHIFLPNLIALNLDGSCLESLRDLGCELKLKYLNVSRCRLRNFDGFSGFEMVEHLVADDNEITSIIQLNGLQELHTLSLRGNQIKQLNAFEFLSTCKKLTNLDLTNNPIVNVTDYRVKLKASVPSLLILDGFGFDESSNNGGNLTECSSSLTSDISKDSGSIMSDRMSDLSGPSRPTSNCSQFIDGKLTVTSKRPSTAGSSSCCSTGEPIVGNIVNKVRRNRRGQHKTGNDEIKTNDSSLASSSTTASLLESSAKATINSISFPLVLPQTTIPLELGIIDTEPITSGSDNDQQQTQDVHQLIEMCRRWRELSRKSRENHLKTSSNLK